MKNRLRKENSPRRRGRERNFTTVLKGKPIAPQATHKDRRFLLYCLIIAGITFAAFSPSLHNGFTNWDDDRLVSANPDIHGFTPRNIATIFTTTYLNHYAPVTMLSFMGEYSLFKSNPTAYHTTNVVFHIINALLVFGLIYLLSGNYSISVLTALLFAIHPLRVESVAWIAERKGMLSAFFYLLSLISYIRYRASGRRAHYALCVLTFVLALMSKSMAMSQPFVLLLIDYLQGRSIDKKSLVEKAPFFGMAGVFACIAYFSVQDTMSQGPHFTIVQSILSPAYNICFYLVKTIFPLRLCALYNMTDHQAGLTLIMGLSAVAVCGIAAAVYFSRRLSKKPIFCALFFLVTLLPTLQIVSSGGWTTIADRYTYIPLIGVYFLIATAFSFLLQKAFRKNRAASIVLMVGGGAVMVIFGFMTYNQCSIWKDGLTLWNDVVNKSPSALAYSNRGFAYATQHEYERAIADYHRAVELNPGYAPIYNNLGNAYSALGDAALALDNYNHAIAIDNRYAQAFGNRGIAYKMTGDLNRAIDDFSQAIRLAPRYAQAYGNLGSAYCYRGDLDKAETAYNRAISLNPEYAEGYYGRGLALCFKGDLKRAVEDFNRAIAINPSYAEAYNSQGVAYRDMGNLQGAIESFTHALSLNSRYAQAYYGRGLAYKALGDFATASEDMHKACDLGIKAACE